MGRRERWTLIQCPRHWIGQQACCRRKQWLSRHVPYPAEWISHRVGDLAEAYYYLRSTHCSRACSLVDKASGGALLGVCKQTVVKQNICFSYTPQQFYCWNCDAGTWSLNLSRNWSSICSLGLGEWGGVCQVLRSEHWQMTVGEAGSSSRKGGREWLATYQDWCPGDLQAPYYPE